MLIAILHGSHITQADEAPESHSVDEHIHGIALGEGEDEIDNTGADNTEYGCWSAAEALKEGEVDEVHGKSENDDS